MDLFLSWANSVFSVCFCARQRQPEGVPVCPDHDLCDRGNQQKRVPSSQRVHRLPRLRQLRIHAVLGACGHGLDERRRVGRCKELLWSGIRARYHRGVGVLFHHCAVPSYWAFPNTSGEISVPSSRSFHNAFIPAPSFFLR